MSEIGSPVPPPPPPIFAPSPAPGAASKPAVPPLPKVSSSAGRRNSLAWLWWSFGLGLFLCIGYLAFEVINAVGRGVSHLGAYRSPGAAELTETVLEDHGARDKVAVIPVEGVIAGSSENGNMVDLIRNQLERAGDDEHVKAVILRIDSPGGEVLASDEIANSLREFQTDKGKPIIVSMQSLCASGGYYISAPCRWIVAHELTITGSIGVIFHGYNYRGLMDKLGVRPKITKSGKLKDMWSPDKLPEEELPEEKTIMQDMVEESFTRFKKVIRDGRSLSFKENKEWVQQMESEGKATNESDSGHKLDEDWETVADGRVMSGTRALEYGFVDEVGDFKVAYQRAERLGGIEKKSNLITYEPPPRFPGFLRLLGQTDVKTVKVDLGELAGLTPKVPQGRLYFLSPTFLH